MTINLKSSEGSNQQGISGWLQNMRMVSSKQGLRNSGNQMLMTIEFSGHNGSLLRKF
jgi:hypothetical protein